MGWVRQLPRPERSMAFSDDKIRFIWVTDVHVGENATDPQVRALELAVNDCNEWRPNAFICTGDVGNTRIRQVQRYHSHVWRCQRPVWTAVGNHDESEYDQPAGLTNIAEMAHESAFQRTPPFYWSAHLTSGDGTFTALCLFLDCNVYDDDPTPGDAPGNHLTHEPGNRVGTDAGSPAGGWCRRFEQAQLDWIAATLTADSSDVALLFVHYEPVSGTRITNFKALADVLQDDPRPMIAFCGHNHNNARITALTTTDTLRAFSFYKCPATLESYSWTRVTLSFDGSDLSVDELAIHNFTNPGGWTIDAPFEVA